MILDKVSIENGNIPLFSNNEDIDKNFSVFEKKYKKLFTSLTSVLSTIKKCNEKCYKNEKRTVVVDGQNKIKKERLFYYNEETANYILSNINLERLLVRLMVGRLNCEYYSKKIINKIQEYSKTDMTIFNIYKEHFRLTSQKNYIKMVRLIRKYPNRIKFLKDPYWAVFDCAEEKANNCKYSEHNCHAEFSYGKKIEDLKKMHEKFSQEFDKSLESANNIRNLIFILDPKN